MTRFANKALMLGAVAVVAATLAAGAAWAQANTAQATPKNWSYQIKDGKRVPKSERVTNADGSWREETRQGNCVTIKEGTASGEVKITRKCD